MSKDVECAHACIFRNQLYMVCHHDARMGLNKDTNTYAYKESVLARSF
jgi:hypothetical protein